MDAIVSTNKTHLNIPRCWQGAAIAITPTLELNGRGTPRREIQGGVATCISRTPILE